MFGYFIIQIQISNIKKYFNSTKVLKFHQKLRISYIRQICAPHIYIIVIQGQDCLNLIFSNNIICTFIYFFLNLVS